MWPCFPFRSLKAEELGFGILEAPLTIFRHPFAGVGAADAKIKTNPGQVNV